MERHIPKLSNPRQRIDELQAHERIRKMCWALLLISMTPGVSAQERQVDPTWLHRYAPQLSETRIDL